MKDTFPSHLNNHTSTLAAIYLCVGAVGSDAFGLLPCGAVTCSSHSMAKRRLWGLLAPVCPAGWFIPHSSRLQAAAAGEERRKTPAGSVPPARACSSPFRQRTRACRCGVLRKFWNDWTLCFRRVAQKHPAVGLCSHSQGRGGGLPSSWGDVGIEEKCNLIMYKIHHTLRALPCLLRQSHL